MQQFKLTEKGLNEFRNKVIIRVIPAMVIAMGAGLYISFATADDKQSMMNIMPFLIPFVISLLIFSIYITMKKQRKMLESYTLTLSENMLTREQSGIQTVSISFNDIIEITKLHNGNIMIKNTLSGDTIYVLSQINGFAELENELQKTAPFIQQKNRSFSQKYPILTGVPVIGLMVCVYTLDNKIIVLISGVTLLTMMSWGYVTILKSKDIDTSTKRKSHFILLVLFSVLVTMIMKLIVR